MEEIQAISEQILNNDTSTSVELKVTSTDSSLSVGVGTNESRVDLEVKASNQESTPLISSDLTLQASVPDWSDEPQSSYEDIYKIYLTTTGLSYIYVAKGEEEGFTTSYFDNYNPNNDDDWKTIVVNSFEDDITRDGTAIDGQARIPLPDKPSGG